MSNLDALRAEFPLVDLLYIARVHREHLELARRYNALRGDIDPADEATITAARKAKARLMEAVSS